MLAQQEVSAIVVYDEDGLDVTPLPLSAPVATSTHKKLGRGMDMMSSMAFGVSVCSLINLFTVRPLTHRLQIMRHS